MTGRSNQATGLPDHHTTHGVRYFPLGDGYDLRGMQEELAEYTAVLLGRKAPPIDRGIMTLMEVAEAYFARASEIEMTIQALESEGAVLRGSRPYRFRTGPLRTFQEMCKKSVELGSRRVTYAQWQYNDR